MKETKNESYMEENQKYYSSLKKGMCKALGIDEDSGTIGMSLPDRINFEFTGLSTVPGDNSVWIGATYFPSSKILYISVTFMEYSKELSSEVLALLKEYSEKHPESKMQPTVLEREDGKQIRFQSKNENIGPEELESIGYKVLADYLDEKHNETLDKLYLKISEENKNDRNENH